MIIDTCRVCPVHIQCIFECSSISRTRLTQFDGLNWLEWWKSNIAYNRIKSNKIDYLNFLWIIWQYRLGQTNLNITTPQHTEPVFGLVCPNLIYWLHQLSSIWSCTVQSLHPLCKILQKCQKCSLVFYPLVRDRSISIWLKL